MVDESDIHRQSAEKSKKSNLFKNNLYFCNVFTNTLEGLQLRKSNHAGSFYFLLLITYQNE